MAAGKIVWKILSRAWPIEQRPPALKKRKWVYTQTLDALLLTKSNMDKIEEKKNLGEEVFSKDGKPEKIRYKKQSDNGNNKLHPARGNRLPIDHPKNWFKKLVPKRREIIIRNFPMDHLGLTGKISDTTWGKMHNRSVKLTLDMFCKTSNREAKGPHSKGCSTDPQRQQQAARTVLLRRHQRQLSEISTGFLWRPIRQEDLLVLS